MQKFQREIFSNGQKGPWAFWRKKIMEKGGDVFEFPVSKLVNLDTPHGLNTKI